MTRCNLDIKEQLKENHISYYDLAQKMGVHEMTVYRTFRSELSPDKKAEVLKAIDQIIEERKEV